MFNVLEHSNLMQKKQATAKPKSVWRLVRSPANDNTPPVSYWIIRLSIISTIIALIFVCFS